MNERVVKQYDPKNPAHEMLALKWFLDLRGDRVEFDNLFSKSLQMLTPFLTWLAMSVSMVFETDDLGPWACAWVAPEMSGAYFGAWFRKDRRASRAAWKFIQEAYGFAFENYECVVGVTKQDHLHKLHLHLGYEYMGELPKWFDGANARIYRLTKENWYGRSQRARQSKPGNESAVQSVHTGIDESVPLGLADASGTGGADDLGAANGGSQRQYSQHQQQRRKRKRIVQPITGSAEAATGEVGSER